MWRKFRKKLPIIGMGFILLFFACWIQLTQNNFISDFRNSLMLKAYDFALNIERKIPKSIDEKVLLLDIDERSIQEVGRWPWPRETLAKMTDQLHKEGVAVLGFDIVFTQPEGNQAQIVLNFAQKNPDVNKQTISFLERIKPQFDYDRVFGAALNQGENVLGYVFHNDMDLHNSGFLPAPLMQIDPKIEKVITVFNMPRYRANIDVLQKNAKHGGFVTIFPDADGLNRKAPLILRFENSIYPSLDLEMARQYLLLDKIPIRMESLGMEVAIESISVGNIQIPTDKSGQIYIPFHKKFKRNDVISAVDFLKHKYNASVFKNALVIIGSSALSLNDIHATPIDPVYPGLYMHADILKAILSGDFANRPAWAPGAELLITLAVGLICIFVFPFLDAVSIIIGGFILFAFVGFSDYWLFVDKNLILTTVIPLTFIGIILLANLVYGFFFEVRHRMKLKNMFGQYVPSALVDVMNENPDNYGFEGESKTMTVLFSDIRSFTTISEGLNVGQLKELLNQYLTPITECIFKWKGTIDKYVGDMVMAFWGAPVDDPDHAKNALNCALEMIKITEDLHVQFQKEGLPPVKIGIGLNTGTMNVGDMGSRFRRAYTVLGNSVNLASRLEGLSKQYGMNIVVGEDTEKNQEDFIFIKLDRVRVKGKLIPTEIFGLICLKAQATPEIIQEKTKHEAALDLYFDGNFSEALLIFSRLHEEYPDKKLYHLYVDRIQNLSKNPPDSKLWDGTFDWEVK